MSVLYFLHQDDDTVSLFVFGEEEEDLAKEAAETNGVIEYNKVKGQHFPVEKPSKSMEKTVSWALSIVGFQWSHVWPLNIFNYFIS